MRILQSISFATVIAAVAALPGLAQAQQEFPAKPIRVVVGFPPGSPGDTLARLFGQKFAEAWGKPVLVENLPGAAGNIGADRVAKETADGGAGSTRLGAWMRPGSGL